MRASPEERDRRIGASRTTIYARHGVGWAWLVDTVQRTLEVLHWRGGEWGVRNVWRDMAKVRAEPFDAIELDLAVLWADVVFPAPPDAR